MKEKLITLKNKMLDNIKKHRDTLLICGVSFSMGFIGSVCGSALVLATYEPETSIETTTVVETSTADIEEITTVIVEQPLEIETTTEVETEPETEITTESPAPEYSMSQSDIELIALVTMAEAEGESELGKRLVIDTILNRIDSDSYPNTATGVIYQKGQFSSMWNGRVDRCYVRDDIVELVKEELQQRTNSDVLYFKMYSYHNWGTPILKEGCHYFSGK